MLDDFDSYHVWLGIPPEEQSLHAYRLLGIRLFEDTPAVIESAADQRMAHLRTYQAGKHAARVLLLNPATFDRGLQAELASAKASPVTDVPTVAVTPRPVGTHGASHGKPSRWSPVGVAVAVLMQFGTRTARYE